MAGEIFDFEWFVNGAGYSLMRVERTPGGVWQLCADGSRKGATAPAAGPREDPGAPRESRWIVSANLAERGNLFADRRYNPLTEHSCLFLSFAEIGPEPADILDFTGRFGLLGLEVESHGSGTIGLTSPAEFLYMWRREIDAMRQALGIWHMIQSGDIKGLRQYLSPFMKWIEADLQFRHTPAARATHDDLPECGDHQALRWFRMNPNCLEWYNAGDPVLPARCRLQAAVNEHLGGRVSPRVLWDDAERSAWSLYFVPNSLIGACWLQMAQTVTLKKDYRRCRQCNTWFEIDHYTARTNRYFCSNACRSKAYRERQLRASELFASGMGIEQIAAELGSDSKTVRGWIKGVSSPRAR